MPAPSRSRAPAPERSVRAVLGADDALVRGVEQLRRHEDALAADVYRGLLELDWFPTLDADLRSWIQLLVQRQVHVFLEQLDRGEAARPELTFLTANSAHRQSITLEQSTALVQQGCRTLVDRCGALVDPPSVLAVVLQAEAFLRETAFEVAKIYARSAERRGAAEARQQARLISALVDELPPAVLTARAAGLVPATGPLRAVGIVTREAPTAALADLHWRARRESLPLVAAVQGDAVLGVMADDVPALVRALPEASVRVAVLGRAVDGVPRLLPSVREVLSSLRALPAHRGTERVVTAEDLLAERAMCGDEAAKEALHARCVVPLLSAGGDLLETVEALLEANGVLEIVARGLPAHVNTVRYRLGRVVALTGRDPRRLRDACEFHLALVHHRLTTAPGSTA
jgi:DNA-binding PucR family transcriptional regulator